MNTLKEIRKKTGLTQVEVAKLIGVSRRTYQTYEEMGRINVAYDEILARLKELGFDTENGYPAILSVRFIKITASEIFAKYPEIQCAYLFGSYARGEATVKSDVDFLVVAPTMSLLDLGGLRHDLVTALHKEVDVVSHTTLLSSERMLRDVLKQGIKVYGQRTDFTEDL